MNKAVQSLATAAALGVLALSSTVAAQPQPTGKPTQECIFPRDISSFSSPNDHTVYLRVGVSNYYKLDLTGPCNNLNFAMGVGLRTPHGSVAICSPLDLDLIVRLSGAPADYCPVQGISKLSPPEVALLGKNKP